MVAAANLVEVAAFVGDTARATMLTADSLTNVASSRAKAAGQGFHFSTSVWIDLIAAFRFASMSLIGPPRHFAATQQFSRFRSEADIQRAALEPDL
jgi:hypothetical protein